MIATTTVCGTAFFLLIAAATAEEIGDTRETGSLPMVLAPTPGPAEVDAYLATVKGLADIAMADSWRTSAKHCDATGACTMERAVLHPPSGAFLLFNHSDRDRSVEEEEEEAAAAASAAMTTKKPKKRYLLTPTTFRAFDLALAAGWTGGGDLWGVRRFEARAGAPGDGARLAAHVAAGRAWCWRAPVFIFSIPQPLFYWHAVVDGIVPLAHTLLRHQQRHGDGGGGDAKRLPPQLLLAQAWAGQAVPRYLTELLGSLVDAPRALLDVDTALGDGADGVGGGSGGDTGGGPGRGHGDTECFAGGVTVGFYPAITRRSERLDAVDFLLRRNGIEPVKPAVAPPPPPAAPRPLRLLVVQRARRCYQAPNQLLRFQADAVLERASRRIVNLDALVAAARGTGFFDVTVADDLEARPVAEQMRALQATDVFVAVHGSAWANALWLPRGRSVALQLFGYGAKQRCVGAGHAYRNSINVPMSDYCENLLVHFPARRV